MKRDKSARTATLLMTKVLAVIATITMLLIAVVMTGAREKGRAVVTMEPTKPNTAQKT